MTLLNATVTPEAGWLSTDEAFGTRPAGVELPRATVGSVAQATADLGGHRAERGAKAAAFGRKFLALPKQKLVAGGAGSLALWLAWCGALATQEHGLDAAAELSPVWLRDLATLQPDAELQALLVGWSVRRRRALGYAFVSASDFEPVEVARNHVMSPMPPPDDTGELARLSRDAAEGWRVEAWRVEAFHTALARVQKAGSERGMYGAAHVAAGRLWLVRVDRDGIDARPVADLGGVAGSACAHSR